MAEKARTPMNIFRSGEAELRNVAYNYTSALDAQREVEENLRAAQASTKEAERLAYASGNALLEQIHAAAAEDADPGDYLEAVLNTCSFGRPVGTRVVGRLAPMREQLGAGPIPVGIVGAVRGEDVRLGLSAGDINVRKRTESEAEFDTAFGIRLEVPLAEMSGFHVPAFESKMVGVYYDGAAESAYVGVKQRLDVLRLASTQEEVDTLNETPHAPFNEHDTRMHHEREIKFRTGFVPFIAYGEVAVRGLLASLYEGRGIEYESRRTEQDDVLAAGIRLGIDPQTIAEVDADALKARLHDKFLRSVMGGVITTISNEASRRRNPYNGWAAASRPITASPQVMRYAAVEEGEIIGAAQRGIERSIIDLRADDPADTLGWRYQKERDYRLLKDEACEIALGFIAVRYGVGEADPSRLRSDWVEHRLAERLTEKVS